MKNIPYAVIHRMAFSQNARGKGISKSAIVQLCKSLNVFSIRIDTRLKNNVIRHILEREMFKYCGLVKFDGSSKLAYELDF